MALGAAESCQAQPAAPAAEGSAAAEDHSQDEYIYVSAMGNLEFFNAHKYGWQWAGDTLGVKTSYVGPAEYDMNAMVAAFDQAIAKQPKGIAVFAVEPILKKLMQLDDFGFEACYHRVVISLR